jgi:hypothetical protein
VTVFDTAKLHVVFSKGCTPEGPFAPRRYTLTHSDKTGDLFLAIGLDHDREALGALQVRLERDEVLGEWVSDTEGSRLVLTMMAQGGLPFFGTGAMRCDIFRHYAPMVLAALRYGDSAFTRAHPELAEAPVIARFEWRDRRDHTESWGLWGVPEHDDGQP